MRKKYGKYSILKVKLDDAILCEADQVGKVHTFIVGSRYSGALTLFQIANVDFGETR